MGLMQIDDFVVAVVVAVVVALLVAAGVALGVGGDGGYFDNHSARHRQNCCSWPETVICHHHRHCHLCDSNSNAVDIVAADQLPVEVVAVVGNAAFGHYQ